MRTNQLHVQGDFNGGSLGLLSDDDLGWGLRRQLADVGGVTVVGHPSLDVIRLVPFVDDGDVPEGRSSTSPPAVWRAWRRLRQQPGPGQSDHDGPYRGCYQDAQHAHHQHDLSVALLRPVGPS